MPNEYDSIKANVSKSHPDWAEKEITGKAAAIFNSVFETTLQHAESMEQAGTWEEYKKTHAKQDKKEITNYFSFVGGLEVKEAEGQFFAEGFISDSEEDAGHDVLENQQRLVDKFNNGDTFATKLSFRHDWMKPAKDGNQEAQPVPFGSLVGKAELKNNPISGKKAAWAKFKLNPHYPQFKDKVDQIREGHINGFSIEYEVAPGGARYEQLGNIRRRYIQEYRVLGVGVAARPMQPNAIMTGFYAKEYELDECKATETHAYGPAATRQESAIEQSQGGNTMEAKEAELLTKQLEEVKAQNKELEGKLSALASLKEDYESFKAENQKAVLANTQVKEVAAKQSEAKEAEAKEFDTMMAEYKESPSWDRANELLKRAGGVLTVG